MIRTHGVGREARLTSRGELSASQRERTASRDFAAPQVRSSRDPSLSLSLEGFGLSSRTSGADRSIRTLISRSLGVVIIARAFFHLLLCNQTDTVPGALGARPCQRQEFTGGRVMRDRLVLVLSLWTLQRASAPYLGPDDVGSVCLGSKPEGAADQEGSSGKIPAKKREAERERGRLERERQGGPYLERRSVQGVPFVKRSQR